jgi:Cu/Ag efflux pump CusA
MTSTQPIEIKIFGDNQATLQKLSKQMADIVTNVKGTADVFEGIVIAGPSVDIVPDNAKLAQFGITPAALQTQVQTALDGNVVGNLFEKEQQSAIRMVYPGNRAQDVAGIKNLNLFLADGRMVPITQLANVEIRSGDAEIERENLQAMGVVSARLDNGDLGSVIPAIQKQAAQKMHLPAGYHIEYGGAYAEQQQSFKELLMILVTASLLVFGVILFLFRQFRIALLILIVAVLGIGGSILALYLTNIPLNVGSYTGLIMIVGIIGENAIFTFWQFRESARGNSTDEAIIYSISTRLRPKLMTALGAIIALLPLALGIGAGAQLHQPLAIAVIGGFLAALPLLLIVLPTMMRLLYKNHSFEEVSEPTAN